MWRMCCDRRSLIPAPRWLRLLSTRMSRRLPGNITAEQALHFAQALGKSEKDRWKIIKTVLEDKVREVV